MPVEARRPPDALCGAGRRVLYAITGHGYGHATRSLAVARALLERFPDVSITLSTSVSRTFLERSGAGRLEEAAARPPRRLDLRVRPYEPGTAERTCFEVDPGATAAAYRRFLPRREQLIEEEAAWLRSGGYAAVVSDIAALPLAAAARAGLPAFAISNFTWDWILEPLLADAPDLRPLPGILAADYAGAALYLRLPFHPAEHPFRAVRDLPLVGRRAALSPAEVRRRLGLEEADRPIILVTVGGFGAGGWPPVSVEGLPEAQVIVAGDLPIDFPGRPVLRMGPEIGGAVGFADLVGASAAVVAKPGYGISSECAANGRPLLAVERRGFREYEALKAELPRLLPFGELSLEDFLAGRWAPALRQLLAAPPAPAVAPTGAERAAVVIGEALGWRS